MAKVDFQTAFEKFNEMRDDLDSYEGSKAYGQKRGLTRFAARVSSRVGSIGSAFGYPDRTSVTSRVLDDALLGRPFPSMVGARDRFASSLRSAILDLSEEIEEVLAKHPKGNSTLVLSLVSNVHGRMERALEVLYDDLGVSDEVRKARTESGTGGSGSQMEIPMDEFGNVGTVEVPAGVPDVRETSEVPTTEEVTENPEESVMDVGDATMTPEPDLGTLVDLWNRYVHMALPGRVARWFPMGSLESVCMTLGVSYRRLAESVANGDLSPEDPYFGVDGDGRPYGVDMSNVLDLMDVDGIRRYVGGTGDDLGLGPVLDMLP